MTLAELQVKRDELVAKIAAGIYAVESGDKSVTFQTISQMREALAQLDSEISSIAGTTVTRATFVQHSRG